MRRGRLDFFNLSKISIRFWIVSISAICTILVFSSCNKQTQTEGKKKIKLGFILATMNQERYLKDRDYFTAYAESKGAEVVFASANDKVNLQASKVETLLAKNIDVLVMQPVDGKTAAPAVRMAKQDGVAVVAYDRLIERADIDAYVTQDSFKVGVIQAEAAVQAMGEKGNVIVLKGEAGHSVAEAITRGNMSVFKKYPNVKVVVEQYHPGWSTAKALSTVENALTRYKNKIGAIVANNDGMALGAAQALDEQGLSGKVFVAGADADLSAIKDIIKGKQTMTVLKGIRPLAEAAVDVALDLAQNKPLSNEKTVNNGLKEVPVFNTPVFKVTKDNIQKQIVDYGFHTAKSVFGG